MAIRGAIGPSSGAAAALVFADEPDALIRSDPKTIASVVVRGRSLTAATRAGEVEIEGRWPWRRAETEAGRHGPEAEPSRAPTAPGREPQGRSFNA